MKRRLGIILLLLLIVPFTKADVCLFRWQKITDQKTGEKQFAFFLAPKEVEDVSEADARGDHKAVEGLSKTLPKNAWMYALYLKGETKSYSQNQILILDPTPCGDELAITSGTINVDRKAQTVQVDLKVRREETITAFVGNGIYPIK